MQFILDSVLTPLITDERKEVILSSVASLEALDYQAALDELHQVVEMSNGMCDNQMLLSRIDDVIWNAHDTIFKQHEIVIKTEAPQIVRQSIVEVLSGFDKYIIPDQLLELFNGGYTSEEIIAQMCQLFTTIPEDEAWENIVSVSDRLLENMRNVVEQQVRYRGLDEADVSQTERVRMVNNYSRTFGLETFSLAIELARNGVRVGTRDIGSLLQQSLPALDKKDAEVAAIEMFGLLLLSNVPVETIAKKARELIDDYTDNNIDNSNMLKTLKPFIEMLKEYFPNESA